MAGFFSGYDLDNAVADLRAEQARIREAGERMTRVTGSATSTDRMVSARVDSHGRLLELKLTGKRYRQLAPGDLTARIVETVRAAQEDAARESASRLSELLPPGLGLPAAGDLDVDLGAMFDAAISTATEAMKDVETAKEGTNDDAR